jgi:hypothetical protein
MLDDGSGFQVVHVTSVEVAVDTFLKLEFSHNQFRRATAMKRDADKIREIALDTEALSAGERLESTDPIFCAHAQWMLDAGLIDGRVTQYQSGESAAVVFRLTWSGCDFLDAARSDTLWAKAKESVIKPSASWTFDILKEWLIAEIKNGMPTLRGLA